MSTQTTPSWLPDLFKTVGRIEEKVTNISSRQDWADTQRSEMVSQLLELHTQMAGMAATISQISSHGPHSMPSSMERRTLGEWAAHGMLHAASLPWARIGVGVAVVATLAEHWLAPAGWLGAVLKWLAGLHAS